jgi:mannose-1-phosphate guanylyltransferase
VRPPVPDRQSDDSSKGRHPAARPSAPVTQAVILAGGEGTRLRPLTNRLSKLAVPLLNEPLIAHNLRHMARHGVTDAIITLCYLPETVRAAIGTGAPYGLAVEYVIEEEPLGTAGALKNVLDRLGETFIAVNGDDLMDVDYTAMSEVARETTAAAAIALYEVPDPSQYGLVQTDERGAVRAFIEKQEAGDRRQEAGRSSPSPAARLLSPASCRPNTINAGAYVLSRDVLHMVPDGRACSLEYEVFPKLIETGARVQAFMHAGYWIDVGRPEAYLKAHRDLMGGAAGDLSAGTPTESDGGRLPYPASCSLPPAPALKAPVCLGENVTVGSEAVVGPNVCIGRGSSVGPGAYVSDSVVWDGVSIGARAELSGCVVCSQARIADGLRIGPGSIVADGSVLT